MSGLEVIGGAAAIAQLITNVAQINSRMRDLLRKARYQSDLLEELSSKVTSVITSAESIPSASCQVSAAALIARRCADRAIALRTLLVKWHTEATKDGNLSKRRQYMIAMTWTEKEREIDRLWKEINDYMELLKFQASCTVIGREEKAMIGPPVALLGGVCGSSPVSYVRSKSSISILITTRFTHLVRKIHSE